MSPKYQSIKELKYQSIKISKYQIIKISQYSKYRYFGTPNRQYSRQAGQPSCQLGKLPSQWPAKPPSYLPSGQPSHQLGKLPFAREAIPYQWSLFPRLPGVPQIDHFPTITPKCQHVTKTYYLLHISYDLVIPRASKYRFFGIPNHQYSR